MKPVIYVEDDANDAFFLNTAFEKAEIVNPLHVISNGQEAIDYLGRAGTSLDNPAPCLVLLDLNLPGRPGVEVLQWIREQPQFYTLPVIILSASNKDYDIHLCYEKGANAYLIKPSSVGTLNVIARSVRDFWLTHNSMPPNCAVMKSATAQQNCR
jgi:CheY-like chemotaxis protein